MQSHHDNNFSILRIVAALMVISGHMAALTGTSLAPFLGKSVQSLGVAIFFLIGGYLISKSWLSDPKPHRYALKRFFRIEPALVAFVLIAVLVVGPFLSYLPVQEYYKHPVTWEYLKNIGLCVQYSLPGVFSENIYPHAVNGSLWTLPVEAAMYILVPILLTVLGIRKDHTKKWSRWMLAGLCFALCIFDLVIQLYYPQARLIFYATDWVEALHIIPFYVIGMVYATFDIKKFLNLPVACVMMLGAACFNLEDISRTAQIYIVLPYFVFSIAFAQPSPISKFFDKFEISYGLYLYGFFIQQIMVLLAANLKWEVSLTVYTIVSTLVTAFVAYLSYRFVEQPCSQIGKKLLTRLDNKTAK